MPSSVVYWRRCCKPARSPVFARQAQAGGSMPPFVTHDQVGKALEQRMTSKQYAWSDEQDDDTVRATAASSMASSAASPASPWPSRTPRSGPASLCGSTELSSASFTRGPSSVPCGSPRPWGSTSARTGE
eukprot:7251066-Pyramimonas_sp.AAC.1